MNSKIDPDVGIKKIDTYLEEVETLLTLPYNQGEKRKDQLERKIKGFIQAVFKDDEIKIQYFDSDRSYRTSIEGTKQKKYIKDLETIKNHLLAFKDELELFSSSRKNPSERSHKEYSLSEIRAGGVIGIFIALIFGYMAFISLAMMMALLIYGSISLISLIFGVGCFVNPDYFGPVLLKLLEFLQKKNSTTSKTTEYTEQNQSNPANSPQIVNKGDGDINIHYGGKSR